MLLSNSLGKLAFQVDKIYIKTIYVAKGSKYPPKQHIQNGPKSEMVYPGIFSPLRFLIKKCLHSLKNTRFLTFKKLYLRYYYR